MFQDALVTADTATDLHQFAEWNAVVVFEKFVVGLGVGVRASLVACVFNDLVGVVHQRGDALFLSFGELISAQSDERAILWEVTVDDRLGVLEEFFECGIGVDVDRHIRIRGRDRLEVVGVVCAADIGEGERFGGGFGGVGWGIANGVVAVGIEGKDLCFHNTVVAFKGLAFFRDGGSAWIVPLHVDLVAHAVVALQSITASVDALGDLDVEFAFFADGGAKKGWIAASVVGLECTIRALGKEVLAAVALDLVEELLVSAVLAGGEDIDLGVGELLTKCSDRAFSAQGLFGDHVKDLDGFASTDTDTIRLPRMAQGVGFDGISDIKTDLVVEFGQANGFSVDGTQRNFFALDFVRGDAFELVKVKGCTIRPLCFVVRNDLAKLRETFALDGAVVVFAHDFKGAADVVDAHARTQVVLEQAFDVLRAFWRKLCGAPTRRICTQFAEARFELRMEIFDLGSKIL